MATRYVVGIDVGGANLKYAQIGAGTSDEPIAYARTFQLWRRPDDLANALIEDLKRFASANEIAVTMTGELADCFADRAIGVRHVVRHCEQAARSIGANSIRFYAVDGRLSAADYAIENPDLFAASNWHALATWVADAVANDALLIDIGSTTTDLIPLADGSVATNAQTDFERLSEGSLVYVGCRRTPVCALVDSLVVDRQRVPVMNEWFATIDDARLVLALASTDEEDTDTADGMPRTRAMSRNRLARMVGLDHRHFSAQVASDVARQIIHAARTRIGDAIGRMNPTSSTLVISGHGHDLLPHIANSRVLSLVDTLGASCSRCAPAYAVARLSLDEYRDEHTVSSSVNRL